MLKFNRTTQGCRRFALSWLNIVFILLLLTIYVNKDNTIVNAFSTNLLTPSTNSFVRTSSSTKPYNIYSIPLTNQQSTYVSLSQLNMQQQNDNNDEQIQKKASNKDIHRTSSTWKNISKKSILATGASLVTIATVAAATMHANPAIAVTMSSTASAANGYMASIVETGFYQAFSLVFVSEIGDKTFFIAGLLAMKTSKLVSFIGSMGALAAMTIISVIIGQLFHAVPSGLLGEGMTIPFDDIAAVLAFAFFGIKTLKDSLAMNDNESSTMDEELEEAKLAVNEQDTTKSIIQTILGIFGLVFAAEFGDRSFISTIALSAAQNPVSVACGAIAAHAAATGIAVSGGAVIAKYLSEKVIGIIGGTLFIVFAITTAFGIF